MLSSILIMLFKTFIILVALYISVSMFVFCQIDIYTCTKYKSICFYSFTAINIFMSISTLFILLYIILLI